MHSLAKSLAWITKDQQLCLPFLTCHFERDGLTLVFIVDMKDGKSGILIKPTSTWHALPLSAGTTDAMRVGDCATFSWVHCRELACYSSLDDEALQIKCNLLLAPRERSFWARLLISAEMLTCTQLTMPFS